MSMAPPASSSVPSPPFLSCFALPCSLVLIQLEGLSGLKIIELLYLNVYNRLLNSCGIKLESPTNDFACPSLQFTYTAKSVLKFSLR
ncbi:hypothetical protein ZWY2020_036800 [Hordeum vulgare]|nr:hypothetical protein ZWY2020_036800 [Hordeum vulgare]